MTSTKNKTDPTKLDITLSLGAFDFKLGAVNTDIDLQLGAVDAKLPPTNLATKSYSIPTYTYIPNPTDVSGLVFWGSAIHDSSLYTTSDKTTNVSADGDPVGYVVDLSGNTDATANND